VIRLEQRRAFRTLLTLLICIVPSKILPKGFCSTGDQGLLVALSADAIDVGAGPRITSSCHCSSLVSSR
jgi:hypothetical protein